MDIVFHLHLVGEDLFPTKSLIEVPLVKMYSSFLIPPLRMIYRAFELRGPLI